MGKFYLEKDIDLFVWTDSIVKLTDNIYAGIDGEGWLTMFVLFDNEYPVIFGDHKDTKEFVSMYEKELLKACKKAEKLFVNAEESIDWFKNYFNKG